MIEDRPCGLPATLQRARDHGDQRYRGKPFGRARRLIPPDLVELDAGGPAGQHAVDIRGGATVPNQDDCGHAYSLGIGSPAWPRLADQR